MINPNTTHGKHETAAVTYDGKIINLAGDKLITKSVGAEHSHTIATDVKVSRDGKVCKVEDLKLGNYVRITTRKDDANVAVVIECLQSS